MKIETRCWVTKWGEVRADRHGPIKRTAELESDVFAEPLTLALTPEQSAAIGALMHEGRHREPFLLTIEFPEPTP